jgi:hypothetical protein
MARLASGQEVLMSELLMQKWQRIAIRNPAVEAEETMNPLLRTLDLHNRWSRIVSVNCGME